MPAKDARVEGKRALRFSGIAQPVRLGDSNETGHAIRSVLVIGLVYPAGGCLVELVRPDGG